MSNRNKNRARLVSCLISLFVVFSFTLIPVFKAHAEDSSNDSNHSQTSSDDNDNDKDTDSKQESDNETETQKRIMPARNGNDDSNNDSNDDQNENDREGIRAELKDKVLENRCTNRQNRIQNASNMFSKSHKFQIERFTRIYDRLNALVVRLDANGTDTSQLKTDLATLKNKIDKLQTKQDAIISQLGDMKTAACDTTGTLNNALTEVKGLITDARAAAEDVRNFLQTKIRPDLLAIKAEIHAAKKEDKGNVSGSTEPED